MQVRLLRSTVARARDAGHRTTLAAEHHPLPLPCHALRHVRARARAQSVLWHTLCARAARAGAGSFGRCISKTSPSRHSVALAASAAALPCRPSKRLSTASAAVQKRAPASDLCTVLSAPLHDRQPELLTTRLARGRMPCTTWGKMSQQSPSSPRPPCSTFASKKATSSPSHAAANAAKLRLFAAIPGSSCQLFHEWKTLPGAEWGGHWGGGGYGRPRESVARRKCAPGASALPSRATTSRPYV